MTPPQLAGNAPILDIFQPVEINLVKPLRYELGFAGFYSVNGRLCQGLHLDKPLLGNARFYCCTAAIAGAYVVVIVFDFYQRALSLQVFYDCLSCFIAIHAGILRIIIYNLGIIGHHVDNFQIMPQTNFEVVRVVCRCNLYHAGSKVHFYIVICYNRNLPVYQRQNQGFAYQVFIPFIVGVDCYGSITQQGFRTGGRQFQIAATIFQGIPQMPEMAGLVFIFHLSI